ncbi:MAG: alpha/beta hydrolase [Proteobacteria bacterium]|nr:alpha/beta hydrolase [Pseudomonadota bacterium]
MSPRCILGTMVKTLLVLALLGGTAAVVVIGPYALYVRHVVANANHGFRSDYFLYVPDRLHRDATGRAMLLVQPNNSGRTSDDPSVHRRDAWLTGFERRRIADELGVVLLVPAFPRTASNWRVYTHALDRDALTTHDAVLARPDLQLIAMIDDARASLRKEGIEVDSQVLLQGFSASAMFANRFTALHPERVRAVAVGSPGGWPIAPIARQSGELLPYPAGIADLGTLVGKPFDAAAFARVPQYFYVGDRDDNDSLDFEDGWDKPAATQVKRLFGDTLAARWKSAGSIYAQTGARARFETVPGIGHDRKTLQNRPTAFLKQAMATTMQP